jgi:hypothetical protein
VSANYLLLELLKRKGSFCFHVITVEAKTRFVEVFFYPPLHPITLALGILFEAKAYTCLLI